ncbi:MAG: ankyrin repeat domain-containing protein [Gemmatimonadetes bacterium]|nr:ankyrin repeat domain-containing protein [Gemmatimonadota bacterium]
MSARHLPVRPDLGTLEREAEQLLQAARAGDADALAELTTARSGALDPARATIDDARLALAQSYQAPSWERLVLACDLVDAIWRDDLAAVRTLVTAHPEIIGENALVRPSNWGPPLTYAANLGRDRIIRLLYDLGARDLRSALDRAALQSRIETARLLYDLMGRPPIPEGALGGPAYTLSEHGTALLFELGARVTDDAGRSRAPVDVVLETDSRKPAAKHAILQMYVARGVDLPDTAPMALHRGRIDLLERHLERDPDLLWRQFTHEEIYPPALGCHDEVLATHGTPLAGATLLHMCMDYGELEIARWLLDRGMDVDAPAALDADGFGGHTALFATVVSQMNFWMNYGAGGPKEAPFTQLLLERGADPNARASLRKQLHPGYGDDTLREYRDVTPLSWGARFHNKLFVSEPAMRLIEERGGAEMRK